LRVDIDNVGSEIGMHSYSANWDASANYNWTKGTSVALPVGESRMYTSYLLDMRSAIEDMATYLGSPIPTPTWAISTITELYDNVDASVVTANVASAVDFRLTSIWEEIQDQLNIMQASDEYWIDSVSGNDTTGDGSVGNPWKTWNKAAGVINTKASGILNFEAGTYLMGTTITTNSVTIRGNSTQDTFMYTTHATSTGALEGDNCVVQDIFFDQNLDATGSYGYFKTTNNLVVNRCVFLSDTSASRACFVNLGTNITFNHCSFIGYSNNSYGLYTTATLTYANNCAFYDLSTCLLTGSGKTVNDDYCAFYDFTLKEHTSGTYNTTNLVSLTEDPQIRDKSNCFLDISSYYVDKASTPGWDIGAYPDSPYNHYQVISELVTSTDATVDSTSEIIAESVKAQEDLTEVAMNINIDMFLGGLFSSGINTISYVDAATLAVDAAVADFPTFTYNGAAMDIRFDNPNSHSCELHLFVDDGTDVSGVAWWDANKSIAAGTTTNTYFINAWKDTVTGDEIGKQYSIDNSQTADFDNSSWAYIKVYARIYDTVSEVWSELVYDEKDYWLNDFNTTMFYLGDNPRTVNGEYANHANYYSQKYHSGTNSYLREDLVDWLDDDRRYIYNPQVKAHVYDYSSSSEGTTPVVYYDGKVKISWQKRLRITSPDYIEGKRRSVQLAIYASLYTNYGNLNSGGAHCFATSTTQCHEIGAYNTSTYPMGDTASDAQYIQLIAHRASDCLLHSSEMSQVLVMPDSGSSGEVYAWGDFSNSAIFTYSQIKIQNVDPFPGCGYGYADLVLVEEDATHNFPTGWAPWEVTRWDHGINTDITDGSMNEGELSYRTYYDNGTPTHASWSW